MWIGTRGVYFKKSIDSYQCGERDSVDSKWVNRGDRLELLRRVHITSFYETDLGLELNRDLAKGCG